MSKSSIMIPDREIIKIPGDGNCAPAALSRALRDRGFKVNHKEFRSDVADIVKKNSYIKDFCSEDVDSFDKDCQHFNGVQMYASCVIVNAHGYKLRIWQKNSEGKYQEREVYEQDELTETIDLIYTGDGDNGHYDLWNPGCTPEEKTFTTEDYNKQIKKIRELEKDVSDLKNVSVTIKPLVQKPLVQNTLVQNTGSIIIGSQVDSISYIGYPPFGQVIHQPNIIIGSHVAPISYIDYSPFGNPLGIFQDQYAVFYH
jgi:hypothetical protein